MESVAGHDWQIGRRAYFEVGDIHFILDEADLRHIRIAGHDVLTRVFVTVRDADWIEVAPACWRFAVHHESRGRVVIRLTARYELGSAEFEWCGEVSVDAAEHRVEFAYTGRTTQAVQVCRIGLVLLHPAEGRIEVGSTAPFELTDTAIPQTLDGTTPRGMTAPFRTLRHVTSSGATADIQLEGGLFEIEDQRNFGDVTLKTYTPPLAQGFPFLIRADEEVVHHLWADLRAPEREVMTPTPRWMDARPPEVGVRLADTSSPTHVQVVVPTAASSSELVSLLEAASAAASRVHVVMSHTDARRLGDVLQGFPQVVRLLVRSSGSLLVPEAEALELREILRFARREDVEIASMIETFPVELNRGACDATSLDLAITLSPSIHSSDALTIAENVRGGRFLARTLAALYAPAGVAIGLATFRGLPPLRTGVLEMLGLPWAIALSIALADSPARFLTIAEDIQSGAPTDDWIVVLRVLDEARRAGARVWIDGRGGGYALEWPTPDGRRSMIAANPGPSAVDILVESGIISETWSWPHRVERSGAATPSRTESVITLAPMSVSVMDIDAS